MIRGLCLHCEKNKGQPYLCPDCRKKRDDEEAQREVEYKQMKCCRCGLVNTSGWTGSSVHCPTCSDRRCRLCEGTGVTYEYYGLYGRTKAVSCHTCNGTGVRFETQLEIKP